MSRKKWNIRKTDKAKATELAKACEIDIMSALILQARGIDTPEKINDFFGDNVALSNPFSMRDMDKAVNRIIKAIDEYEHICIYGDYDCDGLTSTAVLYTYLEANGANLEYYIPSRLNEGYGLNKAAIDKIKERGVKLIITVDNGISAIDEAEYIAELGMELVVTDHHQATDTLPKAVAVVDPHRSDDESPFKEFAGVGVAFKLICAIEERLEEDYDVKFMLEQFGDLVALGTIADLVPMLGENRSLVKSGLEMMNEEPRVGLEALREVSGIDDINSTSVAFYMAPRINAAGRVGDAEKALTLLLSSDSELVEEIAEKLNQYNDDRHKTETEIFAAVQQQIFENPALTHGRVLVFAGENWHGGVMGIVASKIVELYGKPAIVICKGEDGIAHGSCRSITGFSIYDALVACSDILVHFGGHPQAAGLGLKNDDIDLFRDRINQYAISKERVFGTIDIDVKLLPQSINNNILFCLDLLEPYGNKNPTPIFGLFKMQIVEYRSMGGGKHIRVDLCRDGNYISAIKFGMPPENFPFKNNEIVDFAVKLSENVYNGIQSVSVQIVDMRPSMQDDDDVFDSIAKYDDIYSYVELPEKIRSLCPDRVTIAGIYTYIRNHREFRFDAGTLCYRLGLPAEKTGTVQVCLDALVELRLIENNNGIYRILPVDKKVSLGEAPILKKLGYSE